MKQQTTKASVAAHYSATIVLTVCFLAAVILLNVFFGGLATALGWQIDMSRAQISEVSNLSVQSLQDAVDAYEAEHNIPVAFRVAFCSEENAVRKSSLGYYILTCLENYEQELDFVHITFLDLDVNPHRADDYLSASLTELTSANIIVELYNTDTGARIKNGEVDCYRVETISSMFAYNSDSSPIGFAGEYRFTSTMLALLGDNPIAVFTTGNGESTDATTGNGLYNVISDSGFLTQKVDLEDENLPTDTKLVIVNAPTKDMSATELEKLRAYSAAGGDLMVFADPMFYDLPALTELLSDYGVTFRDVPGYIIDNANSLAATSGLAICGTYAEEFHEGEAAKGTALLAGLRGNGDQNAIFPHASAISLTDHVAADGKVGESAWYLSALFTTTNSATIPGATGADAYGTQRLMTVTENRETAAKTMICAAPNFVSNDYLLGEGFANREVLAALLRDMEENTILDARLGLRLFDNQALQISSTAADVWTFLLVAVLPIAVLTIGIIVYVRRKHL